MPPVTGSSWADRAARWLPILGWLPRYRRSWLRPDLMAGLTVWALLVPEAMAYAEIAGMPAETGLYAGVAAIVGYAVFASSRQLFVGPSSTVAILSAATVSLVATGDDWAEVTAALALVVGAMFVAAGLLRLGFVSVFMSKPVLTGFTFGLGIVIAVGQLPKLFGVSGDDGNVPRQLWAMAEQLPDLHGATTAIGFATLAVLLVARARFGHRIPIALVVVGAAIALSNLLDWEGAGVHVVGEIPASLPSLAIPTIAGGQWFELAGGAAGIVLIAFAESFGTAKSYARRRGHDLDADQELIALGAANVGAGLVGGFTVDGSLSRSAAADESGIKTQAAMLICGALTLATIVAFTPVFEQLPEAVLGAIVIWAVSGTWKVAELRRVYRANRGDFAAAAIALAGVCVIGLLPGLALAILTSLLLLVYRASRPGMPTLGRVPGERYYASTEHKIGLELPEGVIVVRLDAPLKIGRASCRERV